MNKSIFISESIRSVSYTHLDVYKRQVPESKSAGASGFDLRAKFNPKIPLFDKSVISRILNHDKDVTAYLYDNCYDGLESVSYTHLRYCC